uniref:Coiled-coil domain-containing protein 62 n=1 Tax=Ciona savignyi TaxID=51511 RepID=H2ZID9_CIOSA
MMHPRFHSSPKYSPGSSGGSFLADRNYTSNSNVKHDVTEEPLQMQDLESETIVKQRKELQLLIGELKDRDKELNEMVAAHHHQLSAWERDRNRVLDLEQKNDRLEVEIRKRNEQLRLLIQRLKVSESRQKKKDLLIDETKVKLVEAQHEIDASFTEKRELETMNDALNSSLSEISSKIGRLEANEQNFVTQLQLKEGDLVEAESEIREVKSKLRKAEAELNECRKNAAAAYVDMEQQKAKYKQCRAELDKTIAEMATKTGDLISA